MQHIRVYAFFVTWARSWLVNNGPWTVNGLFDNYRDENYCFEGNSMAFDTFLAQRIRQQIAGRQDIAEKKMFGGVAFLLNGNMCCGVYENEMIVRLDADRTELALAQPNTRIFDITGRQMKGWILVRAGAVGDEVLSKWVGVAVDYAARLPAK
ncbi:MAG: TfoX/Sxy family protein [Burkholderiales bacterium]